VLQPKFLPSEAIDSIENNKCTAIYTLPNITRAIIQHKTFSRSRTASLRTGLTIGTAEDVRLAAEILAAPHICNVYGLTETYGNCCVTWNDAPLDQRLNGQGPPLPGFTLRIVDPDSRHALKPGTVGEIEVSGRITPGYAGESGDRYNAATKTADGFFITGDLGFLDDDGHFHFVGRNTELIKTGGINVSPVEIETVLQQHDKISEAVVIGATSVEQGQEIVAFIVTRDGFQLDDANLRTYCRERMSTYKVPNTFVFVDSMPVTPTGKLSRKDLKAKWFSKHAAT
jgi:fatty-acyl-CoA synthase